MIARLIATVLIFLFCGAMTTLLVISVLHPQGTGLAKISPRIAFDHFVGRPEGSDLDVWEGNNITGNCRIDPHGPVMRHADRTASVKVNLTILIRLPQPLLNSPTIKLTGSAVMHSTGDLDDLDLELFLPASLPRVSLAITQPAGQPSPSLTLTSGGTNVLFSNAPGKQQDGPMALMVEGMLKSAGLSMDTLSESPDKKEQHAPEVRTGWFTAGDKSFDGFLLTTGTDSATRFDLFMENTGEIVRVDTPLTGANQLGLRLLAESRRPVGVKVPELNEFQFIKDLLNKKK